MKRLESVVVALDGESKVGSTTIVRHIKGEAEHQDAIIPELLGEMSPWAGRLSDATRASLADLHSHLGFRNISAISAGNIFRAASLYLSLRELALEPKTSLDKGDVEGILEVLAIPDIEDVLQNDPNVGTRVSEVAKFTGVQALCGAIFCEQIQTEYTRDGGANLVVVDARDPVGHMKRNGLIGSSTDQIHPANLLPIYIDTPADVSAARMPGDFKTNLEVVLARRRSDATRDELPALRPVDLIADFDTWAKQFGRDPLRSTVGRPYLLENGSKVTKDNLLWLGGFIAAFAGDVAVCNYHHRVLEEASIS